MYGRKKIVDFSADEFRTMLDKGMKIRDIADDLGVIYQSVYQYIRSRPDYMEIYNEKYPRMQTVKQTVCEKKKEKERKTETDDRRITVKRQQLLLRRRSE